MKMMTRKLAMPLLGVLLWVISIHAGTFATATLLPQPITGVRVPTQETNNLLHAQPDRLKISQKDLNHSVSFGHGVINRMVRLETNLGWSNVHVKKGTPAHGQLIVSLPDEQALKQGREALVASKASLHLMNLFCNKNKMSPSDCAKHIAAYSLESTPLEMSCRQAQKSCSPEEILSKYRAIDGSCNHGNVGSLGAAFSAYSRLLHAHYLDGIQEPRRSVHKSKLPSARLVSSSLVKDRSENKSMLTLATVLWSEFVEHDLSHTATNKMVHSDNTIECCSPSGNHLSPRYIHPLCAPIAVPLDDEYYSLHGLDCMTYVRSVPAFRADCSFGALEQMNQATHFLDGSQIYGCTPKRSSALRTLENGQLDSSLKHNKVFLPISKKPDDDCQLRDSDSLCFMSGDSRVNVQPQLTAMHTLWLREHNRIARELATMNLHWDDEKLFQEARRIVIAEMQHITYNEWLPLLLGHKYHSKLQRFSGFDDDVNPAVSNAFATAAARGMYTFLDGKLNLYKENRLVNSSLNLRNYFNNPGVIEEPGNLAALIRGLATQSSQPRNLSFAEDISGQLFSNGIFGFDVFSLDIQRGRDHGIPPYTSYRTLCGLSKANSFNDLLDVMSPEVVESLSEVYRSPHDIDLIVGGISEKADGDSVFGPTFSCIIADQFLRTRRGDRYFYTNLYQSKPMTLSQIKQIEKVTLARVFCDNGDAIEHMQPNVFEKISDSNQLKSCDVLPEINMKIWADARNLYH